MGDNIRTIVQNGETISLYSAMYGCTDDDIRKANNIKGDKLKEGQSLNIPIGKQWQLPASDDNVLDKKLSYFNDKVNEIRAIRPNISLTTDLIVGFPGETEELFQETVETINTIRFSKIHVLPFSLRKGTKAEEIPNHIDEKAKKERVKVMMEISKKLEVEYMEKFLNQNIIFIPEKYQDGYLIGHTGNYLLIKALGKEDDIHKNIEVKINSIDYPYCIGEKSS